MTLGERGKVLLMLLAVLGTLCCPGTGQAACEHYQDTVFAEDLIWQNAVPAAIGVPGYTGDGICPYCGTICEPGREIPAFTDPDPTEAPATAVPVTDPPVTAPPVTEAPVITAPPVTAPPVTEAPVITEPPVTAPPVTEAPVITAPPVTAPPVTEAPVITAPPVTAPPVTEAPVITAPPVTAPPVTEAPILPGTPSPETTAPAGKDTGTEPTGGTVPGSPGINPDPEGGSGKTTGGETARTPFSREFPYRRVRMRPQEDIQIRRAGITVWPTGSGDSAGSPLLKLLGR